MRKEALCQVFRFSVISMVYGSVVAYVNMLSCEMKSSLCCQHALYIARMNYVVLFDLCHLVPVYSPHVAQKFKLN